MLQIDLDELEEDDFQRLIGNPETLRLEFKRELELSTKGERQEAARDVSAFANSAGGRLIYGISESAQPDGLKVAKEITPLSNRGLPARLADIIADTIHPRPHSRQRVVEVNGGGYILVVEVYPSLGRDLHMVATEGRFYRRTESRRIRMSEPEVREAYARIAVSSRALEEAIESKVREQLELVQRRGQSVMVLPVYGKRDLADPRVLMGIREELADGPFTKYAPSDRFYWQPIANMAPYGNGLSATMQTNAMPELDLRFFITRFGVVHLADGEAVWNDAHSPHLRIYRVIRNVLITLAAARFVLSRCSYWGPVHLVQVLEFPVGTKMIFDRGRVYNFGAFTTSPIESSIPELNLLEAGDDLEPVARELCDQVFQHVGSILCPLFKEDGHLRDEVRHWLPFG